MTGAISPAIAEKVKTSPQYGINVLYIEAIIIIGLSTWTESNNTAVNKTIGEKKTQTADSNQNNKSIRPVVM